MISTQLVSDYILATSDGLLTPMKLIKLAYISHGFTLALTNEKLFRDKIEAWKYGPVIPNIYEDFKHYGGNEIQELSYCGTSLNDKEGIDERLNKFKGSIPITGRQIIDAVLDIYGDFSGLGLSTITHKTGTPWEQCYNPNKHGVEISDEITKAYYKGQLS